MQLVSSEAIVLDVFDLHEVDRIVTLLTPEHGRIKGVAKGARRKYSRFAGQLQTLAKVDATWFVKGDRELVRLSGLELKRSAEKLSNDLDALLVGGYLADHMLEFVQENEESRHFYRLLDSAVEALLGGLDPRLVARYFEVWTLRLAGIFPVPLECPQCGRRFSEVGAGLPRGEYALLCRACHHSAPDEEVSQEVLAFLLLTRYRRMDELANEAPERRVLAGVEALCALIRRAFLQRELKSYRVLEQALGGT
ncbi:MAG: DNA repair protein RecO [Thermoanaerobaculia bacterium]|nr:DNA repair protein RecO [Thermoanaerobaculia bacterium]